MIAHQVQLSVLIKGWVIGQTNIFLLLYSSNRLVCSIYLYYSNERRGGHMVRISRLPLIIKKNKFAFVSHKVYLRDQGIGTTDGCLGSHVPPRRLYKVHKDLGVLWGVCYKALPDDIWCTHGPY